MRKIGRLQLNDGSPCRSYEFASCPNCGKTIHEDYIVGEFVAKLKIIDEVSLKKSEAITMF